MRTHIRRRKNSKELIIVYSGWGIDHSAYIPLCTDNQDLILYYNYSADEPLILPERKIYDRITVIAWSLGVWAAEYFSENLKLDPDLRVAINGTPVPADDRFGIPLQTFEESLENIDESGIEKFFLRLFGSRSSLDKQSEKLSMRNLASYSSELRWLYNRIMENPDKKYNWDIAVSSINDRVFPPDNQINYWKNRKDTRNILIDMPHYPFYHWASFDKMLEYFISEAGLDITNQ